MSNRAILFLTHAEVSIDPAVPVPDWGLSPLGQARHAAFAESALCSGVTAVYASAERKAQEAAAPVARRKDLGVITVGALGENDRSATGYLPRDAFEAMADGFFAAPDEAIRGWERARAAQARIVAAVSTIAALDRSAGTLLIVSHGGVGALLRCHLKRCAITRAEDQPEGGGCVFAFDAALAGPVEPWKRIAPEVVA